MDNRNQAAIPIAIVGVGKIAADQHIPTIAAHPRFSLAGAVSRRSLDMDVPVRGSLAALKEAVPELAAVAVCTPPVGRLALIREAFALGLDVLLEKPPARTLTEAEVFAGEADRAEQVLFQSWHSRFAAAVEPARAWLANRSILATEVRWLEDVRVWHPGQEWIWDPGIGVFDPGINALSILTTIFPAELQVRDSILTFPANRLAPIGAELTLESLANHTVDVLFSFDQRGRPTWTITIDTDGGKLQLSDGGARWSIDGVEQSIADRPEYTQLYDRFAELIDQRECDIDLRPFRLVADAFLAAERRSTAAFDWNS